MNSFSQIQQIALWALPVLFAITLHEVAHGYVAKKCGDNTAFMMGRLTLNPIKHIDLFGTIIVPIALLLMGGVLFGWAKPVPVNNRNLNNPKRDIALVAAAGPIANLLMAIGWACLAKIILTIIDSSNNPLVFFYYMGLTGVAINIFIGVLNLIPIPPLDGSRIIGSFLSAQGEQQYLRMQPYGFLILLVLLFTGLLGQIIMPVYLFFESIIRLAFQI